MAKKLLIVDDEEIIHRILNRELKNHGFVLLDAYDGKECIKIAEAEAPDLILLDITMPEMDGNETVQKLKSNKRTSSIPVIMVTGNSKSVDRVVGYELGVEDYVTKPFDMDNLRSRIADLLG